MGGLGRFCVALGIRLLVAVLVPGYRQQRFFPNESERIGNGCMKISLCI
jgi:hypothetical protein